MKTQKLNISVLILSFFLFACGGGKYKTEEPNNTIEEATKIELDKIVEFKIQPVGDIDWFQVEVPANGYLKVSVQTQPENLKLECSFATYGEWEQSKEKFIVKNLKMPAIAKVQKGTCYIQIKDDHWNKGESDEIIQMKIEFIEEFDKNELNDRIEDATEIALNSEFKMALFPLKDIDWFKINLEKPGYVKLSVKNVNDLKPEVTFYKYDQWAETKEIKMSELLKLPAAVQIDEPGTYYFEIKDDHWNNLYSQELFDVKIDFIEQHDLQEPNNDFKTAFEVKSGDLIHMAIFPLGDVDYFKMTPTKNGKISLKTKDVPNNIKLQAKLFINDPQNPNDYIEKTGYLDIPCEFEVEANTEYFFLIQDDRWNKAASENLFELKIELY